MPASAVFALVLRHDRNDFDGNADRKRVACARRSVHACASHPFHSENQERGAGAQGDAVFGRAQIVLLSLAIVAMFASQGSYLLNNMDMVYILIVPILIYFTMNYMLGSAVGDVRFTYEDSVSLHLTIIARNSPVALAIAVTAFPDQPVIALALVIGPLIELPVLAAVSQPLLVTRRMKQKSVT